MWNGCNFYKDWCAVSNGTCHNKCWARVTNMRRAYLTVARSTSVATFQKCGDPNAPCAGEVNHVFNLSSSRHLREPGHNLVLGIADGHASAGRESRCGCHKKRSW